MNGLAGFLQQSEQHVEDLMALGGPVMWPLVAVSVLLWTLVLERYWFMLHTLPGLLARAAPRAPAGASRRARTEPAGVPSPRLDIPAQGTGAPFAPVPGSDSRLSGPPAQWNPDKQPGTAPAPRSGRKEGDGAGGSANQALVVVSRVLPDYPPRARHQGIEGWVRLEIEVTPAGTVEAARVVDAKPGQIFDAAALAAIRRWRFKPAFREGRAVGQRARLTMKFTLKQQ